VKIKVTHSDLQRGKRYSLDRCPLGYAVQREFPGRKIRVGYKFVSVESPDDDPEQYRLFVLNKETESKILAFEEGMHIQPYEVTLTEVIRKDARKTHT
jgi:hypothetical protein